MEDREVIHRLIGAYEGKSRYGALSAAAAALGVSPQVLGNWRHRGIVPGNMRFAVRRLANQRCQLGLPMAWLDPRKAAA